MGGSKQTDPPVVTGDNLVNNSDISLVSNIVQIDGYASCDSSSLLESESGDSEDSNGTTYDTEEENEPINILPPKCQVKGNRKP